MPAKRGLMLNEETLLQKRLALIDEHLQRSRHEPQHAQTEEQRLEPREAREASPSEPGETPAAKPGWLADSDEGLRLQKERCERAAQVMRERQEANNRSVRRRNARPPTKFWSSGRSIRKRPWHATKRACFGRSTRCSFCAISIRRCSSRSMSRDAEQRQQRLGTDDRPHGEQYGRETERRVRGLRLRLDPAFGVLPTRGHHAVRYPLQENDYSETNRKKTQSNQHIELPKMPFAWLPEEQTYQCSLWATAP